MLRREPLFVVFLVACLLNVAVSFTSEEECAANDRSCLSSTTAEVRIRKEFDSLVWTNALISTGIISVIGNVGIVIYLFIDDKGGNGLKTMVAFAVGGLLGDVFLHLIPHGRSQDPHDSTSGLQILAGVIAYFIGEKLVRMYTKAVGHTHAHGQNQSDTVDSSSNEIRPGAWLNLFADITHNFVDGMAIAAAYRDSSALGGVTTFAVLVHEIPHEMGDFAVLLSQGFSKRAAFFAQFVSAIGAFAGCIFGLQISSSMTDTSAVLNFTAGGFIYVALVDVLPELLQDKSSALQLLREIIAIALGIYIMVMVAEAEAQDHHGHTHTHGHGHNHDGATPHVVSFESHSH